MKQMLEKERLPEKNGICRLCGKDTKVFLIPRTDDEWVCINCAVELVMESRTKKRIIHVKSTIRKG